MAKLRQSRITTCGLALAFALPLVISGETRVLATPEIGLTYSTSVTQKVPAILIRPTGAPTQPTATPKASPAPVKPTTSPTPTVSPTTSPSPKPSPTNTAIPQPSPNPSPSITLPPAPPISQYAYGALKFVRKQVGKRYVVGGNGPDVFDCSGLMQQAWKAVGIYLPRVSGDQYFATVRIQYSDLQPGDMVFFGPNGSRHVGMYIGDNKMIDAANPRAGIKISDLTLSWYRVNLAGYGRVEANDF